MKLNGNKAEVFEKIARLMVNEVPRHQICAVLNCDEMQLQQVLDMEEYKKVYGGLLANEFEQEQLKNEGWDSLEARAISGLIKNMQWNQDPEFLLKVAVVSNKANRRSNLNKPLQVQSGNQTAVITLNATFIEKLERAEFGDRRPLQIDQKKQDFLDVNKVEKMLGFKPGFAPAE